jgi:hypothetical protein
MKNIKYTALLASVICLLSTNVFAGNANDKVTGNHSTTKNKIKDPALYEKVIEDYKAYLATVPPQIRDEVIGYRKEIAKLNKQKKLLFKQMSQASQNYLKKERQFKKKLPLGRKSLINVKNPGVKPVRKKK